MSDYVISLLFITGDIKIMQSTYERVKTLREKRKQQGWQWVSQLVPPQLAKELKEYTKQWRLNNPNAYNRTKW